MKIRRLILKVLLFLFIITTGITISDITTVSSAANPSLNTTHQYIKVSEKYSIKLNNKIDKIKYTWASSAKKVATVNSSGVVTAISAGETKITCTYIANKKTITLTCSITAIDASTIYTINEDTKPSTATQKKSAYNENTKYWYLFNEILQLCEKGGGGKIVVQAGTYGICRKVSIPSNVTIILEHGAIIKKLNVTGTNSFAATKTMFQLVEPSKENTKGYYSSYSGVHDVKIIGEGTATIDLDYIEGAFGFVLGHNQNISFENITFRNMNSGHFIEMDASKNVTIKNCSFLDSKESPKFNKEAINIDTPDSLTGGFSHEWSSMDKTPVKNLLIEDCTFEKIDVGIGTHKYSQVQDENGQYSITMFHEDIHVKNCTFRDIRNSGFKMIAWKNVTVEGCLFETLESGGYTIAFKANAADNLTFRNNICKNIGTVGGAYSSTGTAPETASYIYTTIKTNITVQNIKDFYTNQCINVQMPLIFLQVDTFEVSSENVGQTQVNRPDLYGEGLKYSLKAIIPSVE